MKAKAAALARNFRKGPVLGYIGHLVAPYEIVMWNGGELLLANFHIMAPSKGLMVSSRKPPKVAARVGCGARSSEVAEISRSFIYRFIEASCLYTDPTAARAEQLHVCVVTKRRCLCALAHADFCRASFQCYPKLWRE